MIDTVGAAVKRTESTPIGFGCFGDAQFKSPVFESPNNESGLPRPDAGPVVARFDGTQQF
jgi:hypothetical protein